MLAGKLDVDRRVELTEDVIVQASANSIGQYVLVVIGQASPADYSQLHNYVSDSLSQALPSPSPPPVGSL